MLRRLVSREPRMEAAQEAIGAVSTAVDALTPEEATIVAQELEELLQRCRTTVAGDGGTQDSKDAKLRAGRVRLRGFGNAIRFIAVAGAARMEVRRRNSSLAL